MSSLIVEHTYLLENKYKSIILQIMNYCFVNNIPLSKGEMEALSYFYVHGINEETENIILEKKIFKNIQSLKNLKSKFIRLNIIDRKKRTYFINNFMNIGVADKIGVSIKAANKQ